jgi:hypothetical protein
MSQGHGSTALARGYGIVISESNGAATKIHPCRYSSIHVSSIQFYLQNAVILHKEKKADTIQCSFCPSNTIHFWVMFQFL